MYRWLRLKVWFSHDGLKKRFTARSRIIHGNPTTDFEDCDSLANQEMNFVSTHFQQWLRMI